MATALFNLMNLLIQRLSLSPKSPVTWTFSYSTIESRLWTSNRDKLSGLRSIVRKTLN